MSDGSQVNRPEAPEQFAVAPVSPRRNSFPEFHQTASTRGQPNLPPVANLGGAARAPGSPMPLSVAVGNTKTGKIRNASTKEMSASGLQPVQQLIYGGKHKTDDEPDDYTFDTRDTLRIYVKGHKEFSGVVEVQQDGTVAIPNTEDFVMAKGKTVRETIALVAAAVAPYVKGEPEVHLQPKLVRGQFYHIFGEVRNQGRFPMGLQALRLSEVVFRANSSALSLGRQADRADYLGELLNMSSRAGFNLSKYADLSKVSVITPHRSRPTRASYNVKSALYQGVTGEDPVIQPGQIVFVPSTVDKRMINFFERVVAPLSAMRGANDAVTDWYHYSTGNPIRGIPEGSGSNGAAAE